MRNKRNKSLAVIILASGVSKRVKKNVPKQYLKLHNKSLIEINIDKFKSLKYVAKIVLVVNKTHSKYYNNLKKKIYRY